MQGQRGTIGSLPETLNFDHGSTSSNAAIDQQVCWNNIRNPVERLPDFMLSANEMNISYSNSFSQEQQDLSRWSLGEPSYTGTPNEVSNMEQKIDHGSGGPRLEEHQYEQNSLFIQSSNSGTISQSLNLNAGLAGHHDDEDDCQIIEPPYLYKSTRSVNEHISSVTGPESFILPSGSDGCSVEDNDSRPGCSLEGRRASCKRKALEANVGQSSTSGSSIFFHGGESSTWPSVPSHYSAAGSLRISASSELVNPRLELGVRGLGSESNPDPSVAASGENSQRNFRMRISPSSQQESVAPPIFSTGNSVIHSVVSSSLQTSGLLPIDRSLELRSTPVLEDAGSQNQNAEINVPSVTRNVQAFRWNEGSGSSAGSSSSSNVAGDRNAEPSEQCRLISREGVSDWRCLIRNSPRITGRTAVRNAVRNPTRSLTGGNISIPGNVASTSNAGSSSGANQSSAPNWVAHPSSSSQYPRRISELVRQSLLSSPGPESVGQSSNHSPHPSGPPTSPEETMLSSGFGSQGHNRSYPRSLSWLERQVDGVSALPHTLRTLAAASEGRSRLFASEIRNVLDIMRRRENLRFEDAMILDQSGFLGMADIHDQHRDMRLDVDNMSYEELLALEERIGNVSTGLSEEAILSRLKQQKFSVTSGTELEPEPCCICLEEYNEGEDLGTLECGHGFHTDCVKKWLMHKNICPICKTTGLTT